ncbi:MAG TPA: SIS domain-containing protein [Polyangiaceae bacterium]
MSQLYSEILAQPEALQRLLANGWNSAVHAAERINEFAPAWVLIAARGASGNAARYAQYLFGAHNHLCVGFAAPSLISRYRASPRMSRALVIGISQSGQSPDVVAVLDEARRQGSLTLALTNEVASPLASACSMTVPICAGAELAVAATMTYTNALLALAMLSVALEGDVERRATLDQIPRCVQTVIDAVSGPATQAATAVSNCEKVIVLGRGFNYCTAFEIALKLQELCYLPALAYSPPELLHGPAAMLDAESLLVRVVPVGVSEVNPELDALVAQRGSRTLAISNNAEILAQTQLRLPDGPQEWTTPILAIVAGQLFAHALCLARGNNPDLPRGLAKVTRTL